MSAPRRARFPSSSDGLYLNVGRRRRGGVAQHIWGAGLQRGLYVSGGRLKATHSDVDPGVRLLYLYVTHYGARQWQPLGAAS